MTARFKIRKVLKVVAWTLSIVIVFGYGTWKALILLQGPKIAIEYPLNGTVVSDPFIEIRGNAKNISFIKLNGSPIYLDTGGTFKEHTLLSYGYNVITTEAVDRFGRSVQDNVEIIYK